LYVVALFVKSIFLLFFLLAFWPKSCIVFYEMEELMRSDKKVVNGLAAGFGVKILKFHFNYAYSKYALNGNSHTFGITTNFNYFHKK
ncbi:MAG: hypothetical protein V4506_02370, partial [Bacteroidota bacterium]